MRTLKIGSVRQRIGSRADCEASCRPPHQVVAARRQPARWIILARDFDPEVLKFVKSKNSLPQSYVVSNKYLVGRGSPLPPMLDAVL